MPRRTVLLASVFFLALVGGCTSRPPPVKLITKDEEAAYIRKEIKALEKSLPEEIARERSKGTSEEQIEAMKGRYKAEIDRLNEQLAERENGKERNPKKTPPDPGN